MTLGTLLTYFAVGFIKGMTDSQNRPHVSLPEPGRHEPSYESYDFGGHMRMLARSSGIDLTSVRGNMARFAARIKGRTYELSVMMLSSDIIKLSALSLATFRPGHLPRDIWRFAMNLNKKSRYVVFDTFEGDDCAFFFSTARCEISALSPEAFETLAKELIGRVYGLDEVLIEKGYVE